jgi:hypothetical protein
VSWWFAKRYSIGVHNGYGWKFDGVNEANIQEFKTKLAKVSSRTTKLDVAHLLPAFDVQRQMLSKSDSKCEWLEEWVDDLKKQDVTHIAILTHLKETAHEIADKIPGTTYIDGEILPDARVKLLAKCKEAPQSIIVGTMHSMGVGIDMTFCQQTAVVELFERPETIIQVLGRFSRLSGKAPSTVTFVLQEGTEDEKKMFTLGKNIEAINQAVKAGDTETRLGQVFSESFDTPGFLGRLQAAVGHTFTMEE